MQLHTTFRKAGATAIAVSLVLANPLSHAGDLNAEVTNMFNNLGAIGNYTAPGAFKGQTFNTYTGGNLYFRSPNKTYQLAAIQFPSAQGRLRRHRSVRRIVLAHLGGRVPQHAAQHHGCAARHRVSARAGVGLAPARRPDQVGEGPGDLRSTTRASTRARPRRRSFRRRPKPPATTRSAPAPSWR